MSGSPSRPEGSALNNDLEIGRLQGALKATQDQQELHYAENNERFRDIHRAMSEQSVKLDALLSAQQVAMEVRRQTEVRQDQRAKRIAVWASVPASIVAVIVSQLLQWALMAHPILH